MGDVLEGAAVPDAEGSQGFGQTIESAHRLELTPVLATWQQAFLRISARNPLTGIAYIV